MGELENSIPFSEIGIVGGITEINAMQIQEAAFGLIGAAGETYGEEKKIIFLDRLKESL